MLSLTPAQYTTKVVRKQATLALQRYRRYRNYPAQYPTLAAAWQRSLDAHKDIAHQLKTTGNLDATLDYFYAQYYMGKSSEYMYAALVVEDLMADIASYRTVFEYRRAMAN